MNAAVFATGVRTASKKNVHFITQRSMCISKSDKGGTEMIIEFYWGRDSEERFLLEVKKEDGKEINIEEIKQLLDRYREEDEYYNSNDWAEFLEKNGYFVRMLEPEKSLYFWGGIENGVCECGGETEIVRYEKDIPILKCKKCGDEFEAHEEYWR